MAEGALSKKLSALDAISQLADSDLVYVVTANGSRKMTGADLRKELVRNSIHQAAVDPTANDDSDAGFYQWQYWYNTATEELWRCLDASPGVAVWAKTTLTLDELGTAATKDTGTADNQLPTNAELRTAPRTENGTSYTYALADVRAHISHANAAAIAVTVPTNASVAFPIGTVLSGEQGGAGQCTLQGEDGTVVIHSEKGLKTTGQYAPWALLKVSTNEWRAYGSLTS